MKKLKRSWILLLIPLSILIILITKYNSDIAEYLFARKIYLYSSQAIGFVFGWIPFSIAEMILVLFVATGMFLLIRFCYRFAKAKRMRIRLLKRGLLNFLCIFSIILFLYVMLCGTNYYRKDFATNLDLTVTKSSSKELTDMCYNLAQKVNEARANCTNVDENGVLKLDSLDITEERAREAMSSLGNEIEVLDRYYSSPKPIQLSKYLSYTGITGIFIPFTMEANVNIDTVEYNIPADMCHELAHMAGFMKEEEANYIAYLACTKSQYPEFIYSGYMSAFIYTANALYDVDSTEWKNVYLTLNDDVLLDLAANRDYWNQFEDASVVSAVSTNINNTYLKINGQENGVNSYGDMVDLLLAEYRK